MTLRTHVRMWFGIPSSSIRRPTQQPFRPGLEPLEDLCLLSASPLLPLADGRHHAPELRTAMNGVSPAQVHAVYRKYLRRRASAAELKQGMGLLNGGDTDALELRLLGSAEYFKKRAKKHPARWLAAAAQDVLGHPLSDADAQRYGGMVGNRGAVAVLLLRQRKAERTPPLPLPLPVPVGGGSPPKVVLPPIRDLFTLAPDVATTTAAASQFLYAGTNPVQTGVAAGTIDPVRVAVLRGRAIDRDGAALPGVTVGVLNHPEFGSTKTQADGWFDLAVNGGGTLTVTYSQAGFLPVQRSADVPWQDYVILDPVALVPLDTRVSPIDLSAAAPIQVAQGNAVTDADGTRQATLLFSQGTQANMTLADGTTRPLTTLNVRATEYTVGPNGPLAMPGELPPASGYTYCVELSVDEAMAAGATAVNFDRPVLTYVDNFLNFRVGMAVPAGYYDRQAGLWVASDNGRVVKILSEGEGLADIDGDGDGDADTVAELGALGFTDAERRQLATLYDPGKSLWRVPITHFTPWDCNWPYGPPEGAQPPNQPKPANPQDCGCDCPPATTDGGGGNDGTSIDAGSQTVNQEVGFPGLKFNLHHDSGRSPAYNDNRSVEVPLSGDTLPPGVKRITLTVDVAGRRTERSFTPDPNQTFAFSWDGLDAYGRTVQGAQPTHIEVGYVYDFAVYQEPAQVERAFGAVSGFPLTLNRARLEFSLSQSFDVSLNNLTQDPSQSLGGWGLAVHHVYDPVGRVLHLGDGTRRALASPGFNETISTVPGSEAFSDVVAAPDGSLYVVDEATNQIKKRSPNGTLTVVAGNGEMGFSGDGGPATLARLSSPRSLSLAPDGSVYFFDGDNVRVRRVSPNGIITTVAGNGQSGTSGEGVPATQTGLRSTAQARVAPDGSLYVVDYESNAVRRVTADGIIRRFAGGGDPAGGNGDGGPVSESTLTGPRAVAFGDDGSVFIAETHLGVIRKVDASGIITTYGGGGNPVGGNGDGGPARLARFTFSANETLAADLAVGPDGSVYALEGPIGVVRKIGPDGIVRTLAGNRNAESPGDGGPATAAGLLFPRSLSLGPDGGLYIAEAGIRRVGRALPGFSATDLAIPAADGSEVYVFTAEGRHLRTLDALTGVTLYSFAYDSADRLVSVTDVDGSVTRIERDAAGKPTAVVAPFGQRTTLETDANGNLSRITDPTGAVTRMTYKPGGLLETFTDPLGKVSTNTYDAHGRLTKSANDAGGFTTLTKTMDGDSEIVTTQTAEGRTTISRTTELGTGAVERLVTGPDGVQTRYQTAPDGTKTITTADGTVTTIQYGPDPRFGMLSPLVARYTVQSPGGLTFNYSESRAVTLADPENVLSLTQLVATTTVNGDASTSTFDAGPRTVTTRTAEGHMTVTTLDALGRVVRVDAPGVTPVAYAYDARGRLVRTTQGTRTSTLSYGPDGLLVSATDSLNQTVRYIRDAAGRVVRIERPDGTAVGSNYDLSGQLTSVAPPSRPAHTFAFNDAGDLVTYTPPDLGPGSEATQALYNLDRQATRVTRPDGTTIALDYDAAGRLRTQTIAQGTTTLTYGATTGLLTGIAAPGGEGLAYGYDGGLLNAVTWSGTVAGSVSGTFDDNFRLAQQKVNGGNAVSFQYDDDGLMTQAGALVLARDLQSGRLTSTTLGAITDTVGYDPFGSVSSYTTAFNAANLFDVDITRDAGGRIIQRVETVEGDTQTLDYTYDAAGQLTQVKRNNVVAATYAYDANGNRLGFTGPGGSVNGTYDAQDRLTQYGGTTYAYTASGELQSRTDAGGTTGYAYDALGDLRSVTLAGGTQIDYVIDGEGRRVGRKVNGTLVQGFLYDGLLRPVAELDGAGNIVSRFVCATGVNVPDYMVKGGVTYRLITDPVGSVRLVVDTATGAVAQRLDYDEFGRVLADSNPGFQPFGFAGGLYDRDTGLVRFGVRDYDAETGRWTTKDPIGFAGGQTNLYAYANNDPVNSIDPLGLAAEVYAAYARVGPGPGFHIELFGYNSSTGDYFEAGGRGPGLAGLVPNSNNKLWAEVNAGKLQPKPSNFADLLRQLRGADGTPQYELVRQIAIDPCLSYDDAYQRLREQADGLSRLGFDYTATPRAWNNGSVNSNSAAGWMVSALGGDPAALTSIRWTPGLGVPVPRR